MFFQKTNNKKIFSTIIVFVALFVFNFSLVQAAPDDEITYHGKLTDTSDVPVTDGNYDFTFTIYDAVSGGSCLWSARGTCGTPTSKSIAVNKGIFYTILGESGDNALSLDFNSNYWIEIKVGTDSAMTPRRKVTATGYSLNSGKLNGQSSTYYLDTSATEQTKSGNLNVSGNFALTQAFKDKDGDVGTSGQILSSTVTGTDWVTASAGSTLWDADADTGIQVEEGADEDKIRFDTAGVERMIIDDSGLFGIGQSTPTARTHIKGSTSDSTAYALKLDDSSDSSLFSVRNDGLVSFGNDLTNENALKQNDYLMPTNPFGGKTVNFNQLHNALFLADRRWTVVGNFYNKSDDSFVSAVAPAIVARAFDGNYETFVQVPLAQYLKIEIDFGGSWSSYGYGYVYASHYHTGFSESSELSVYSNYEPHIIGWHYFNMTDYVNNEIDNLITRARNSKHLISLMNVKIVSPDIGIEAKLTQLDWVLERPVLSKEMPFLTKFIDETLYNDLDFKDDTGNIDVHLSNDTDSYFLNNLGLGTSLPTARTHIKGSTSDSTAYALKLDDSLDVNLFNVRNDGAITIPNTTFANSSAGVIYKDSVPFIHNFNYGDNGTVTTIGQNTFIGENAGNFTMGSTATSDFHSSYNTFSGRSAGLSNTTGYNNTFSGVSAGLSNTTGYNNTFSGVNAGYLNTTGYSNTFSGVNAGRYIADGITANETTNSSIFLGRDTKALADGDTNEIVIGYDVIGKGSNSVNLGNDSITETHLNGEINLDNYKFPTADGSANQILKTDGAGTLTWQNESGGSSVPTYKSSNLTTQGLGSGSFYNFGFYESSATDANLTQASTTVNLGTANSPYGAHVFIVAGGVGSASGGTGAVEIEVSGTSITDAGVRTTSDTEIVVADITTLSTNDYLETGKKWIGQTTFTLKNATGSTQTTFNADFNYGLAKYEDFGNRDFTLTDLEIVGYAGATDTGWKVELLKHSSSGWTYSATSFVSGGTIICDSNTDLVTENDLTSGEQYAYKRASLATSISGSGSEGIVVRTTTTTNNAVEYQNIHIGAEF